MQSVLEYEIPAFLADKKPDRNGTTEAFHARSHKHRRRLCNVDRYTARPYSMLLQLLLMDQRTGTNDIGVYAFLTNSQIPGKVLTDYTNCVYSALDAIYASPAASTLCS
jgi:hypothetical protein